MPYSTTFLKPKMRKITSLVINLITQLHCFTAQRLYNLNVVPQLGLAGEKYEITKTMVKIVPFTAGDILFGENGCRSRI